MNPSTPRPEHVTRRERRAAARREQRAEPRRRSAPRRPAWQSPFTLLTAGALLVGALIVGALQLLPGRDGGGATAGPELIMPVTLPLAELTADRTLGSASAPVTMTVWSDFQCPACRVLAEAVEPRLVTEYVATGKLRIEYRDLIVIGPESVDAAVAARCAGEQDRFWDFHGVLYANQSAENSGGLSRERFLAISDRLGLDRPAFEECLAGGHLAARVQTESAQGMTKYNSTPTLEFSNGDVIRGVPDWQTLAAKIDELVAAAA